MAVDLNALFGKETATEAFVETVTKADSLTRLFWGALRTGGVS